MSIPVVYNSNKYQDKKMIVDTGKVQFVSTEIPDYGYRSNGLERISDNGFIDTTDSNSIAKYQSNLNLLANNVRQTGVYNKFVIMRNDSFLPSAWQWEPNGDMSFSEDVATPFTYAFREEVANRNAVATKKGLFGISKEYFDNDKYWEAINMMGKNYANIAVPTTFRSTKHFTVNTPLGYTGEYNLVDTNRDFTIIDSIDNFLNSGYGYSLSDRDAYLDITHEPLKVSKDAIVLISDEKFKELKDNNPALLSRLNERNLMVYHGDLSVAENMILTEMGILPARCGEYYKYDEELQSILNNSFLELANENGMEYNRPHAGPGGHFSNTFDSYNRVNKEYEQGFIDYLNNNMTTLSKPLPKVGYKMTKKDYMESLSGADLNELYNLIQNYNNWLHQTIANNHINYQTERCNITPDVSSIFKETFNNIKLFENNKQEFFNSLGYDDANHLEQTMMRFFHDSSVAGQLDAAQTINELMNSRNRSI